MWVTQTYLGNVEPDAKLFVYYFFEDYNSDQKKFTQRVQRELENLGDVYGDQVSLLMPNPRYANKIESEMRKFDWNWFSLQGKLPGLFLSPKPISKLERNDKECFYLPFDNKDAKSVAEVIRRIRGIADNTLNWDFANQYQSKPYSLGRRFADALELKPGIWGFKIDLRKLFEKH
jgi:hypothetical protein